MKSIKRMIGVYAMGLLVLASQGVAEKPCPAPPSPNNNNNDHHAPDPVFILGEMQPAVGVNVRLGQLREQVVSKTSSAGEQDRAVLEGYEAARKEGPQRVYDSALSVWSQGVSPELKQYVLLASLPAVKTTEQVETLRFMLASLNDLPAQTGELAALSKGNGLEKAKAARLMGILSKNPQLKL